MPGIIQAPRLMFFMKIKSPHFTGLFQGQGWAICPEDPIDSPSYVGPHGSFQIETMEMVSPLGLKVGLDHNYINLELCYKR